MNAFEYNPIRILCGSLTPTTLAAVIADLDANDKLTDEDQCVANEIRAGAQIQLDCMVGTVDAQRLISRS